MKTNQLFTSVLALATIVVTSCSTQKLAQQDTTGDDVYNTTAQAKVYKPVPVQPSQNKVSAEEADDQYADEYYGTSDPYYDMDYSSRINRFYYSTPWSGYYDPYFYGGWNSPFSLNYAYSPFYNNFYGGGWGYLYSPFYSYNNWGWNNYYGYLGGGYYGGGFLGGGYYAGGYYGGGFYTGRTTNIPNYRSRPTVGRDGYRNTSGNFVGRGATRTDDRGNVISTRSRAERYGDASNNTRAGRSSDIQQRPSRSTESQRPTRTESAPAARPSYSPPARTESSGSSSGRSSSGSSSSGSRPTRAGRG